MPVLQFSDVSVLRGDNRILDSVSWTVNEDERWVILGPNGAGKTTLLQMAAAQSHPSSGRVTVLDERLGAVDVFELRPRIGLTSTAFAETIPPGERVLDLVMSAGYAVTGRWHEQYLRVDARRAADLLATVGVAGLGERRYGSLSEGERKRVQIARALASYNAGDGNVDTWTTPGRADPDVFTEYVPFQETHDYVKRIQQYWWINRYIWAQ